MKASYWAVLAAVAVVVMFIILVRAYRQSRREFEQKFDSHPAVTGIQEYRGNCVRVSPMAIVCSDNQNVDLSEVNPELFDRVMRMRMIDIIEWTDDPAKNKIDDVEVSLLKRMATVQSAITGVNILKRLMLIDHMTKALYVGIQQRLELVEVDRAEIERNPSWMARDAIFMGRMSSVGYAVKQEFLNALAKNEYDYFHLFATRVQRRIRKGSVHNKYSDHEIQSCITAHAYRMNLMIPRSYQRYDAVTFAIANWDKEEFETITDNVVTLKRKV